MITNCNLMFSGINMVKADFTSFDFSQVTTMAYMFQNCYQLINYFW